MARPRLTESARVSIALKVSQVDAARIDEVLTRPEFAGWTRAEWCREIIRTALRYYVGDAPAPDPGQARVPAQPAAAQRVPPEPAPAGAPPGPAEGPPSRAGEPGAEGAGAAGPMPPAAGEARPTAAGEAVPPATGEARPSAAGEPLPASRETPERPVETECPHPAEARDWQTGTCAACGAVLWD
ncbi:MAG TPA: hypothetical protein VGJ54_10865 [Streptosporangiaceae bacterium]